MYMRVGIGLRLAMVSLDQAVLNMYAWYNVNLFIQKIKIGISCTTLV